MPTPIVVLNQSASASQAAVAYATLLAKTMAVPVCPLQIAPISAPAGQLTVELPARSLLPLGPSNANSITDSEGIIAEDIAPVLAKQDALLLVMPIPVNSKLSTDWPEPAVWSVLQAVGAPLLLVPGGLSKQALPLHIALATDGDPFTLIHGQRAMHALLLTLPIHITVLHAPVPHSTSSPADALQTLLTCGMAARYLTTATALAVQAGSAKDGILAGMRQVRADLLVLIVRQASLEEAGLGMSVMAALLQQSPVPVLLLLATAAAD